VRPLAEELHERLSRRGLTCTLLSIEAETTDGELCARMWRHGSYSAAAGGDRLRWALEGWLTAGGRGPGGPRRLAPQAGVPAGGGQLEGAGADRGAGAGRPRAGAGVRGLPGRSGGRVPVPAGGRDPAARVAWLPWDDERQAPPDPQPPWPGGIPPPYPATV